MLNPNQLQFDALGKVRNTTSAPNVFSNGVGFNGGLLCVDLNSPQRWQHGLPFNNASKVCVQTIGTPDHWTNGGLPVNEFGCLAVDTVAAVAYHSNGLPFTAGGRIAFAASEPPVVLTGFSNGFSNGFGA
jgi:hypothetical protein